MENRFVYNDAGDLCKERLKVSGRPCCVGCSGMDLAPEMGNMAYHRSLSPIVLDQEGIFPVGRRLLPVEVDELCTNTAMGNY